MVIKMRTNGLHSTNAAEVKQPLTAAEHYLVTSVGESKARSFGGNFVTPFPDETVHSMLSRYALRKVGYAEHDLYRQFLRVGISAHGYLPAGLDVFFNATRDYWRSYEDFVRGHSFLPAMRPFFGQRMERQIVTSLADEKMPPRWAHYIKKQHPKFCIDCLKHDIIELGQPYWHRKHQLPATFVCTEHRRWLISGCECGWPFDQKLFLPRLTCKCGNPMNEPPAISEQSVNLAMPLARYGSQILKSSGTSLVSPRLQDHYFESLKRRGFASRNSVDRDQLLIALEDRYSKKLISLSNVSEALTIWCRWVDGRRLTRAGPIVVHYVVGQFLFDTWDNFVQELERPSPFDSAVKRKIDKSHGRSITRAKPSSPRKKALINLYYGRVVAYLEGLDGQGFNHQDAPKDVQSAWNRLLRLDKQSTKLIWKKYGRGSKKISLDYVTRDANWSTKVRNLADERRALEPPKRVSKTFLMNNVGLTTHSSPSLLPRTFTALEKAAEGRQEFRVRKTRWAIAKIKQEGKPVTRYSVLQYSGLSNLNIGYMLDLIEEEGGELP